MPKYTSNYNLIVPEVTDNVVADIIEIGESNIIIDTTMKNLSNEDIILQGEINDNYTFLDTKINTEVNIVNDRIDQLVLHAVPLPEVAAQQVYDACFSPVYDITYTVLTDRITYIEQSLVDIEDLIQPQIDALKLLIFSGGIG